MRRSSCSRSSCNSTFISLVTPEIPSNPHCVLSSASTSVGDSPSLVAMRLRIAGSRSPDRVPITRPSSGVIPIDLQLVDAGLLAGVVGSQLPDRFEPVAGLGQACGVRDQIGLLVRHEEPAQLCFGLGDACRGGFELREDVVGVSHPAGILHQFRRSAIDRRTDADQADGQPGSRGLLLLINGASGRVAPYLIPITMESGPTRYSTCASRNPASFIQPMQSAPV